MRPAPLSIGLVSLTVNDLDGVVSFYERTVGLERLARDAESARLGAGGTPLLELRRDAAARRSSPREAGLFHTAFLLPERADLARWIAHAAATGVTLDGASDHIVSEALYLADPEGNGVEIYVDRPAERWVWRDGAVKMATDRLDFDSVMAASDGIRWRGAPTGTRVGHVHLRVGALDPAEAFYAGELGFDVTCRYPGATFFSTGGYHHHLASNIWNSRNAPPRTEPTTGLAEIRLIAGPERNDAAGKAFVDPWGVRFTVLGVA